MKLDIPNNTTKEEKERIKAEFSRDVCYKRKNKKPIKITNATA